MRIESHTDYEIACRMIRIYEQLLRRIEKGLESTFTIADIASIQKQLDMHRQEKQQYEDAMTRILTKLTETNASKN